MNVKKSLSHQHPRKGHRVIITNISEPLESGGEESVLCSWWADTLLQPCTPGLSSWPAGLAGT